MATPPPGRPRLGRSATPGDTRRLAAATAISMLGPVVPFVVGALGGQIETELGISTAALGLAIAVFFVASAISSIPAGAAIEAWGAIRAARLAGVVNASALAGLAWFVRDMWGLAAVMAIAGVGNAIAHPAVNGLIGAVVDERRRGFTLGLKQAAIPGALLIAGLVVPLSLSVASWRTILAVLAGLGVVLGMSLRGDGKVGQRRRRALARESALVYLGLASAAGITAMNGAAAFLVPYGAWRGLDDAAAGLVLVVASLLGIATRVVVGSHMDRSAVDPRALVTALMLGGGVGALLMPVAFPWALGLLCVAGWGWPGLMHLVVLRRFGENPAAATGVVEVGTYVGGAIGPATFGLAAEVGSFDLGWLLMGGVAVCGAAVLALSAGRHK